MLEETAKDYDCTKRISHYDPDYNEDKDFIIFMCTRCSNVFTELKHEILEPFTEDKIKRTIREELLSNTIGFKMTTYKVHELKTFIADAIHNCKDEDIILDLAHEHLDVDGIDYDETLGSYIVIENGR